MLFPYWEVHGDGDPRLLPLVPLTIRGWRDTTVVALVDSGAEHNVFGNDVAERVGVPLDDGTPVTVTGIGDHHHPGTLISLELQLGKIRWTAPTIISPAANDRVLLGQAGFFAFFTVTFRLARKMIEIRRSHA